MEEGEQEEGGRGMKEEEEGEWRRGSSRSRRRGE